VALVNWLIRSVEASFLFAFPIILWLILAAVMNNIEREKMLIIYHKGLLGKSGRKFGRK